MKTGEINKTIYISPEFLDELKEGYGQFFNFSRRVNELLKLGLQIERITKGMKERGKLNIDTSALTEEVTRYIKLGKKVEEGELEGAVTLRSSIKYLVEMYNKKNPNNPIN